MALLATLPGSNTWPSDWMLIYAIHAKWCPAAPIWTNGNPSNVQSSTFAWFFPFGLVRMKMTLRAILESKMKEPFPVCSPEWLWGTDLPFRCIGAIINLLPSPSLALGGIGYGQALWIQYLSEWRDAGRAPTLGPLPSIVCKLSADISASSVELNCVRLRTLFYLIMFWFALELQHRGKVTCPRSHR